MDFLCCCSGRRKSTAKHSKSFQSSTSSRSRYSDRKVSPFQHDDVTSTDFQTLEYLRQRIPSLTPAQGNVLLSVSYKLKASLTPREIEDLYRVLAPPPQIPQRKTESPNEYTRPPRTPTNHMMPAMQSESLLFCLPAELRARIWQYAVGGHTLYLGVENNKLVQQQYQQHVTGLLNVPLVCRTAYLESINLLYSETTFAFGFGPVGSSKEFFTKTSDFLLPQCTAAMRSLRIGFHLTGGISQYYDSHSQAWDSSLKVMPSPESLSSWNAVFDSLARLEGLRRLVVVVWTSGDRRHEFKAREPELMEIPSRMKGLEEFEVWLPWAQDEESRDAELANGGPTPYVVRRDFEEKARFGVSLPRFCS